MDSLLPSPGAPVGTGATPLVAENIVSPASAAAATVTPDAQTAEILRKHTAGEKLTAQEGGKLGAFKRKLKSAVGLGTAKPVGENPFVASAGKPPVALVASAQTSAGGLPDLGVDAGFARRTAISCLNKISAVEKKWITRQARAVGVEGNALANIVGEAGFDSEDTQLIGELAPDICAELGINPRKSPLIVAGAILTAHASSLVMAVLELKEMGETKTRNDEAAKKKADAAIAELEKKA